MADLVKTDAVETGAGRPRASRATPAAGKRKPGDGGAAKEAGAAGVKAARAGRAKVAGVKAAGAGRAKAAGTGAGKASVTAAPAAETPVAEAAAALVGAVGAALSIRKKDLVERVVNASGAKRKQVRDIVEHTLKVLGDALSKGEALHLPPFGKASVSRSREGANGTTMMVKVKQGGAGAGPGKPRRARPKEGVAATEE